MVRATISGKEDRRFDRVELIPDETDLETRVELEARAVPFEDSLSMAAYEAVQDDERVLELTGKIKYVFTDWDLTDEHTGADDPEYVLRVRGEEGSTRLRVRYDDYDYETLERIELFEDVENPVTLMDKNANESENSNESADGESQDAS
ncbi:hypothetical protein LOC71_07670 [Rhodopirellula sp. JC740]|uniref:Uncharacterized protein n=1 Tax=Rhodopirellula halodulae TaxID=2894198 RepID=A0ABS8NH43_9BACT|nr:hypothetical protein [Rhodopirellula sp. JC740]MCC9642148.1 hypothetical protein [Rhodopirellula sp. JC740]